MTFFGCSTVTRPPVEPKRTQALPEDRLGAAMLELARAEGHRKAHPPRLQELSERQRSVYSNRSENRQRLVCKHVGKTPIGTSALAEKCKLSLTVTRKACQEMVEAGMFGVKRHAHGLRFSTEFPRDKTAFWSTPDGFSERQRALLSALEAGPITTRELYKIGGGEWKAKEALRRIRNRGYVVEMERLSKSCAKYTLVSA